MTTHDMILGMVSGMRKQAAVTKRANPLVDWLTGRYRAQGVAPAAQPGWAYRTKPAGTNATAKATAQKPSVRYASSMSSANPLKPVAQFGNALRDTRMAQLAKVQSWGR